MKLFRSDGAGPPPHIGDVVTHVMTPSRTGQVVSFLNYGYLAVVRWDADGQTVTHPTANLRPAP